MNLLILVLVLNYSYASDSTTQKNIVQKIKSVKISSFFSFSVKCFKMLFRIYNIYSVRNSEVQNPQRVAFIGITDKQ